MMSRRLLNSLDMLLNPVAALYKVKAKMKKTFITTLVFEQSGSERSPWTRNWGRPIAASSWPSRWAQWPPGPARCYLKFILIVCLPQDPDQAPVDIVEMIDINNGIPSMQNPFKIPIKPKWELSKSGSSLDSQGFWIDPGCLLWLQVGDLDHWSLLLRCFYHNRKNRLWSERIR